MTRCAILATILAAIAGLVLAGRDAAARYQLLAEFWTAASPDLAMLAGVVEACRTVAPGGARP